MTFMSDTYINVQRRFENGKTEQIQQAIILNDNAPVDYQVRRFTTPNRQGAFYLYWGEYSTWRAAIGAPRSEWSGDW